MTSVLPFSSLKRSKTFRHYINLPGYVTLYPDPGVTFFTSRRDSFHDKQYLSLCSPDFIIFLQKPLILAQKKPPRCISAGGGSVLIAQGVYARVSILCHIRPVCDSHCAASAIFTSTDAIRSI
jgi:hypothetical protein